MVITADHWITHGNGMVPCRVQDYRSPSGPRPRILVVLPCYNAQHWITPCLSALDANAEPHDILLVEDGGFPLKGIPASDNLIHCRIARNIGLIGVLNFAARFALEEGYYFYARQDADDFSMPDRLSMQRAQADSTGADLTVSGVQVIDGDGRRLWDNTGDLPCDLIAALSVRNIFVHSTWFLRTSVFERIGCYDDRYVGAEDYEFAQRIVRAGTVSSVVRPLVQYRVHNELILATSNRPARTTARVVWRYFSFRRAASYQGLIRSMAAVCLPRSIKVAIRKRLSRTKVSSSPQQRP